MLAHRIHFVDKDALNVKDSYLSWGKHKAYQLSGYAKGLTLYDFKSSPADFLKYAKYHEDAGKELTAEWEVTPQQANQLLAKVDKMLADEKAHQHFNYGYVVYSDNVDNCGSMALKLLSEVGIDLDHLQLGWKEYLPLPSLVKGNFQ